MEDIIAYKDMHAQRIADYYVIFLVIPRMGGAPGWQRRVRIGTVNRAGWRATDDDEHDLGRYRTLRQAMDALRARI